METQENPENKKSKKKKTLYIGGIIALLIIIILMLFFLLGGKEDGNIFIYFKSVNLENCSDVVPVPRSIDIEDNEEDVIREAIEEMFKGLSLDELENGLYTSLNPAMVINSISLEDGIVTIDFNSQLTYQTDDCRREAIISQIKNTAGQFNFVDSVDITVEGKSLNS